QDIDKAEFRFARREQQHDMQHRQRQRGVAGPVMDLEVVDPFVRPPLPWVVLHAHEKAEEDVARDDDDGNNADVGGKLESGHSIKEQRHRLTSQLHVRAAGYSVLSASIGSTRVARSAGTYDAASAIRASRAAVPTYTSGSSALTPNINETKRRVDSAATIAPATRPAPTSRAPCASTRPKTSA